MATRSPYQPKARLGDWIRHLDTRAERIADPHTRTSVEALSAHLRAFESGDPQEMEGTITGDARLRIWGWDRGRQAEYTRPDLPRAYQSWREILGESVQTLRVDIDRFFPGRGRIGLDGILSVVVPAGMLPNGAEDREPASSYLVARRVAWFGDVEDRRLSEMDLYVSIRESIEVHRRPTDALDRGLSPG